MTGCLSLLARLGRNEAGNTLAIAAAALLPMMALIGGGVDISRSYMAKTELQSACDAGVLAGRKAMSKSGNYDTAERAKADRMFNFNFNGAKLDATDVWFETDDNEGGQVEGTAHANVPTLVMKIFDKDQVDLEVNCMAELQIGNADVMFVLDVTGSMDQPIKTGEDKKIDGLKAAVFDFHKTVNQAVVDNRTRIRYGFVPYSQTVNLGGLVSSGAVPTSYLVDSNTYQTRRAVFGPNTVTTSPYNPQPQPSSSVTEVYASNITENNCYKNSSNFGNNKWPSGSSGTTVNSGGPAPAATTVTTYAAFSPTPWVKVSGSGTSALGTCKRTKTVTTTTYTLTTWYLFDHWKYEPVTYNTSSFKAKNAVKYATDIKKDSTTLTSSSRTKTAGEWDMVQLGAKMTDGSAVNVSTTNGTWSGCIEERTSESPSSTYDYDPIPSDAYDMDLELAPSDAATSWRPQWGALEFDPTGYSNYYYRYSTDSNLVGWYTQADYRASSKLTKDTVPANNPPGAEGDTCPSPMMLFRNVELTEGADDVPSWLTTYINGLKATGSTYHDLGMIWGGRLTASEGIFSDNVNLDSDKINVSKHIIFMTDGKMEPTFEAYSAYGIEKYDHRVLPSGSTTLATLVARHNARFAAVCEAIKAQGVTIWVIAFGTSMTTQLQNCASSGRSYYSSNTTALRNTFKFIASEVADLRLGA
jgi:Flp pilus assembly protein TadG